MKLLFDTKAVMEILSVDTVCFKQLLETEMLCSPIGFKTAKATKPGDILLWTQKDLEDCVQRLDEQRQKEIDESIERKG